MPWNCLGVVKRGAYALVEANNVILPAAVICQ